MPHLFMNEAHIERGMKYSQSTPVYGSTLYDRGGVYSMSMTERRAAVGGKLAGALHLLVQRVASSTEELVCACPRAL